jgi:thiol-disulfide isomerase/thioredoxin
MTNSPPAAAGRSGWIPRGFGWLRHHPATFGLAVVAGVTAVVLLLGGELCPVPAGERPRGGEALALAAGRVPASPLTTVDLDGRTWDLSSQRDRVVVVNLFATWCPPCRAEMPELAGIAREYEAKGVTFLGLSLDEGGAALVRAFVKRYALPFPVALAKPGMEFTAGVTGIPVTVIIDRRSRVARTYVGQISGDEVRHDLDALLAEPAPAVVRTR